MKRSTPKPEGSTRCHPATSAEGFEKPLRTFTCEVVPLSSGPTYISTTYPCSRQRRAAVVHPGVGTRAPPWGHNYTISPALGVPTRPGRICRHQVFLLVAMSAVAVWLTFARDGAEIRP